MKYILFLAFFFSSMVHVQAQDSLYNTPVKDLHFLEWVVIDGDTLPTFDLDGVTILPEKERTAKETREFERLKRYVGKVYPYAHKAVSLMKEIEYITADLDRKRHKKKYLRGLENELKGTFKDDLKKLTTTQGKILIKMIERETGETFYSHLKDLKNPVTAFFYHNLGKRYGYNLKEGYDATKHEDLEEIMVFLEENGAGFLHTYEKIENKVAQFGDAPPAEEILKKKKKKRE